jgi:hypothetical protein
VERSVFRNDEAMSGLPIGTLLPGAETRSTVALRRVTSRPCLLGGGVLLQTSAHRYGAHPVESRFGTRRAPLQNRSPLSEGLGIRASRISVGRDLLVR